MRIVHALIATMILLGLAATAPAANITGEYLEARTCKVFTGPCFANAEVGLSGQEALLAWKVEQGQWNDVSLDGLGAAIVLSADGTLGSNPAIPLRVDRVDSVILVDERATPEQHDALVAFVKDSAGDLAANVVKVESVPIELTNDHLSGKGQFTAGDVAKIETRAIKSGDCVCSNEIVFYPPLADVQNYSPAHYTDFSFRGEGLNSRWSDSGESGAFLATFRK